MLFWKFVLTFSKTLGTVDDVLLKKERIVIPQALRMDMFHMIHEGHLGIKKCKRRARDLVFWPGINKDIEVNVKHARNTGTSRAKGL